MSVIAVSAVSSSSLSSGDICSNESCQTFSDNPSHGLNANEEGLCMLSCASAMVDMCKPTTFNSAAQSHKVAKSMKYKRKDKNEDMSKSMRNQDKIAKRIYKQALDLFNSYDKEAIFLFIDQYVASDFYMRDANKQYLRPYEMRSEGKSNLKALIETYFACVPDSVTFVDKMEVLKEGKLIRISLKHQGTMLNNVALNNQISPPSCCIIHGNSNEDQTSRTTIRGVLKCFLDDRNKIKRLEWNPTKRSE